MNVSPPWFVSGLSKSANKKCMIGFKLDRVESWLNEETTILCLNNYTILHYTKQLNYVFIATKLWRQNNSLSKRGGVGREGLLKILGG